MAIKTYVSAATLAHELDVSETTVHEMVKRGVLPRPIKLSAGCVRWRWADVQMAVDGLGGSSQAPADPYMARVG